MNWKLESLKFQRMGVFKQILAVSGLLKCPPVYMFLPLRVSRTAHIIDSTI